MRSMALAGLAVLLVAPVAYADEPTARSAASVASPKSDDQTRRPEGLIATQYAADPGRI